MTALRSNGPTVLPEPPQVLTPGAPTRAIEARRKQTAAKIDAVRRAIQGLDKARLPATHAAVRAASGVSRTFLYENSEAVALMKNARNRGNASLANVVEERLLLAEASDRERAANAEDALRRTRQQVKQANARIADLLGQLREPDGTWLVQDRDRLRERNEALLTEREALRRETELLRRQLDAARANVSRLSSRAVTQLYHDPDSPRTGGRV